MQTHWPSYYDATSNQGPRPTLLRALQVWQGEPGFAVDVGCGAGHDTLALLARGWRVHAIDAEPNAFERIERNVPSSHRSRLTYAVARFETMELPKADLVNASLSLPFCKPGAFVRMWQSLESALRLEGLFAGHLFGNRDTWAARADMTTHSRTEVDRLFHDWTIIELQEREWDGATALGVPKYWHVFEIAARRSTYKPAVSTK